MYTGGTVEEPDRPIRSNLKFDVVEYLRRQILVGQLKPGSRIPQDEVAQLLGISKLPVREALITLESEGLVDNIARRGAFVAPLEPEDFLDHFAIYGALSGIAAERAALTLTEEELARLEELLELMLTKAKSPDVTSYNEEFHRIINLRGASRRLRGQLRQLAQTIPVHLEPDTDNWPGWAVQDHAQLVAAFRARDKDAAGKLMREHLTKAGPPAVADLKKRGFWDARPPS